MLVSQVVDRHPDFETLTRGRVVDARIDDAVGALLHGRRVRQVEPEPGEVVAIELQREVARADRQRVAGERVAGPAGRVARGVVAVDQLARRRGTPRDVLHHRVDVGGTEAKAPGVVGRPLELAFRALVLGVGIHDQLLQADRVDQGLIVLVVVVVDGAVEAQGVVQELGLDTGLVGGQRLGLEGQRRQVGDRGREQRRRKAAALHAAVVAEVEQLVGREVEVDLRLAAVQVVGAAAVVVGGQRETVRARQLGDVAGNALRVVQVRIPAVGVVLLVVRNAAAEGEAHEFVEPVFHLAEGRVGLGLELIRRLGGRQPAVRVRLRALRDELGGIAVRPATVVEFVRTEEDRALPALVILAVDVQTVQARRPVQGLVAAVQPQFKRLLRHVAAVEELENRVRGRVRVFLVVLLQCRVIADGGEVREAEVVRELRRKPGGLDARVARLVIACRERAAVGQATRVATRAGAVEVLVRAERAVVAVRIEGNCKRLPRARVHVLATGTAVQQQLAATDVLEQELAAHGPVIAVLGVRGTASDVVEQRVVVVRLEREAAIDAVPQLTVDRALDSGEVALPDRHVDVATGLVGGAAGHEIGETAGRVATEQRALGTAEHLDPVHVEHGEGQTRHLADVDVVDVDGRRTFLMVREVILGHAADRQAERRGSVGLGQHHGRHGLRDVTRGDGTELGQLLTGDRGQRDADVLRVLRALLRGDNDFFEPAGGGGGRRLLRKGIEARGGECHTDGQRESVRSDGVHTISLRKRERDRGCRVASTRLPHGPARGPSGARLGPTGSDWAVAKKQQFSAKGYTSITTL